MAFKLVSVLLFLMFLLQPAFCNEVVEHTPWGDINWTHYTVKTTGIAEEENVSLFEEENSLKTAIRFARIKAFKRLYELVLNIALLDDKPLKEFFSKNKTEELFQKIYNNTYVLGWMNIAENKIEVSIRLNLLKTLSDYIQPYMKNTLLEKDSSVFIVDARSYELKPSLICKIFDEKNTVIYSSSPKYFYSMEEALLYAGPRKINFIDIKDIKSLRCSFVVSSTTETLYDVIIVLKNEE